MNYPLFEKGETLAKHFRKLYLICSSTTSMVSMVSSTAASMNLLSESSIDSISSERTNTDLLERGDELSSSDRGSNEGSTASLASATESAVIPARKDLPKPQLRRDKRTSESNSSLESSTRKQAPNAKSKSAGNKNYSGATSQESLISENMGGEITYHRYYHVFREGELDQLIEKYVENLHIISSYYDHASWCIVAEKVQVWTI
ncbi:hypothetical protein WA026_009962 [Henosepilachna vigintioctopunctata]|uniref:Uncharacterized protein n=1 Tax=Henosepilachna vigintioctopunctata TaxID=420089 RepID=A0AAW1TJB4_9CUCU